MNNYPVYHYQNFMNRFYQENRPRTLFTIPSPKQFVIATLVILLLFWIIVVIKAKTPTKYDYMKKLNSEEELEKEGKKNKNYKYICSNTRQGKDLITDSKGFVCNPFQVNPDTKCCPETKKTGIERYSCLSCDLEIKCCEIYEYCVSCCLNSTPKEESGLKGFFSSFFQTKLEPTFKNCKQFCRTSSDSVVNENIYKTNQKFCFDLTI
ncbi:hypothetical protein M0811_01708 [Anaeramoeba ignava]|uniref:SREBP regulating gene protein n=1 Tax=Anaeramoeba ignava TaxID=1746090 RepID=A0A9Q0LD80_ANAIG|nr:hypothetical protein M0811_01708 [Anaeramoeba ignava]